MGTNYYCRRIPTKQRKLELCNLINTSNNFSEIIAQIDHTYGSFDYNGEPTGGVIHLGKLSGGWKFLWNPNIYVKHNGHLEKKDIEPGHSTYNWVEEPDTYYYVYPLTKDGIWDFIKQDNIEVFNEYGEVLDKEKFFNEALEWTTWIKDGKVVEAFDGKSYELSLKEKSVYLPRETDENIIMLKKCGYNVEWPFTDFYSDGLRFATSNNFS